MVGALWAYLVCVASFGIYALVLIYRHARDFAQRDRASALSWSLGSLAAPIACAVLHELSRTAARDRADGIRTRLAVWVPCSLHGAIAAILLTTDLSALWTPVWIAMPISIVIVDAQIRRARRRSPLEAPPTVTAAPRRLWPRVAQGLTVVLGLPIVVLIALEADESSIGLLWIRADDGVLHSASGAFALTTSGGKWHRVEPGTVGDDDSEIEVMSTDQQSWVVGYQRSSDYQIDTLVDMRRNLITESMSLQEIDERRFLPRPEAPLPASIAHYRTHTNVFSRGEYVVLTARLPDGVVELVGFTSMPATGTGELVDLLSTFELVEPTEEARP